MIQHHFDHGMFVRAVEPRDGARGGTIVYVHGLGESGLCFEEVMLHPDLGSWRHLAPDLPGYGRSPWTGRPWSLEEHADHLARWIREQAPGPVALVGHSMGGVCGLLLCERRPSLVDRFLNVEGNVTPADCTASARAAAEPLEGFLEGGFERLLEGVYRAGLEDEPLRRYYASMRHCDPRMFHQNSRELVALSRQESGARRLAALSPETRCAETQCAETRSAKAPHFVAGAPGGAPQATLARIREAGVPLTVMEGCGHWPFLDDREGFVRVLRDYLEGS